MKKILIVALLSLICCGCVTMPTQEEIARFDYGAPLTIDYQAVIKNHFNEVLFDPYSAVYEFEMPQTFWFKRGPLAGGGLFVGYAVFVRVNAKNRMGGYVGKERYAFLFKNNLLELILSPSDLEFMRNV